jgi:PAS domain S-box-containing protein
METSRTASRGGGSFSGRNSNDSREPAVVRQLVFSVLILGFALLGFAFYYKGWLKPGAGLLGIKDSTQFISGQVRHISLVAGLLVAGGTGVHLISRRNFQNQLERALQERDQAAAESQKQLARMRILEIELQGFHEELESQVEQRTRQLSQTCVSLQKELDKRKLAEKDLSEHKQHLERSKDVLRLHVLARTEELQKLQRQYELILNSAGEGIFALDMQGRVTFANPAAARLTGWKLQELVGKTEQEIFFQIKPGMLANRLEFLKDSEGEHLTDQNFYRCDGSSFVAEYMRTPIQEKDRVSGAVVVFKDITERKQAEETLSLKAAELARSNAELEQFAFVASHDLQEPLRKIQSFGDRLKKKCESAQIAEGHDYLERMQNAAARMQTLIQDLLTFSRVIRSSQPFVSVDLGVVTREVMTDLEDRIEKTHAMIEMGDLPTIEADPLQMRQLLQNLIGNALKFQAPGATPHVRIQARLLRNDLKSPGNPVCELTVQDNGIGFEEVYLEKMFAVFQRLHGRDRYEGTGIGLAVCRRIAERHKGHITAHGKLGEGATFIVTLPCRQTSTPTNL